MMRSTVAGWILGAAVSVLFACGGGSKPAASGGETKAAAAAAAPSQAANERAEAEGAPAATPELPEKVRKAVEVAKAIEARPEDADAILERAGLDRDGLEALMMEIAADPKLAEAYEAALLEG